VNALGTEIAAIIAHEGPISLERYMTLCLQHPRHGYYMTRDPFGASGDFVTAPEISQMFGEMLGVWIGEAWTAAGRPADARLVELGPGRGVLMSDVLRVARVAPGFLDAISVDLVETSPVLREAQARTLEQAPAPIKWRATFGEIPRAPLFILANEFFDALPARHFVRTEHGPPFRPWRPSDASIARPETGLFPDAMGGWRERLVGTTAGGKLAFGLAAYVESGLPLGAPAGSIIEINVVAQRLMSAMAERIVADGGALLLVDYGYTRTTLGESLQAVARHAYVDPLEAPGEADLTTHVDFAALRRAALAKGAKVQGPVSQGSFLAQLGIERRAETLRRKATARQLEDIDSALARLIGFGEPREHMGELFKAMAVMHPDMPDMPGFES
jgi:NADH dehydrogenase [ubiquinone] 1 alpha subcomplex assembly factor 7